MKIVFEGKEEKVSMNDGCGCACYPMQTNPIANNTPVPQVSR